MQNLIFSQDIHPQTVVTTTFHSTLGESKTSPLCVYVMDKIAGDALVKASFYDESTAEAKLEVESRRLTTVEDFAQYIK